MFSGQFLFDEFQKKDQRTEKYWYLPSCSNRSDMLGKGDLLSTLSSSIPSTQQDVQGEFERRTWVSIYFLFVYIGIAVGPSMNQLELLDSMCVFDLV